MLTRFFETVRQYGVPASTREYLDLLAAMQAKLAFADIQEFYYLARAVLVKNEVFYDRFDLACQAFFQGLDTVDMLPEQLIPKEWLHKDFIRQLSDEDKARIKELGSLEKLTDLRHSRRLIGLRPLRAFIAPKGAYQSKSC